MQIYQTELEGMIKHLLVEQGKVVKSVGAAEANI